MTQKKDKIFVKTNGWSEVDTSKDQGPTVRVTPDRGDFKTHGTFGVSNAIGYEIELSKDGDWARALYTQETDGRFQITDWFEIRDIIDEDGLNDRVFEAFGADISLSLVMVVERTGGTR